MRFIKFHTFTLAFVLAAAAQADTIVQAADTTKNQPVKEQTKKQKEQDLFVQNVQGDMSIEPPILFSKTQFFIRGDALLWKANEDGLQYVRKLRIGGNPYNIKNNKKEPHFSWDWGCRAAVGLVFGPDKWDLTANWTHFINEGRGSSEANDNNKLIPDNVNYNIYQYSTHASSHVHLHFNTLDLELGRHFFVSRNIDLHPHIGARGAWIGQSFREKFDTHFAVEQELIYIGSSTLHSARSKVDNDFAGGGLRGGLDSIFHFNRNFALFARGSVSLLYGRFNVHQKSDSFLVQDSVNPWTYFPFKSSDRQDFDRVRTNVEGALGIQWEQGFYNNKYHLTLGIAYEIAEWFGQNQQEVFGRDDHEHIFATNQATLATPVEYQEVFSKQINGDLGIQGVSLKLQFDF